MATINCDWDTKSIKHYKTVEDIQCHLRQRNSQYLCKHPELRAIIRMFLTECVEKQPTNMREFYMEVFDCSKLYHVMQKINKELKRVNAYIAKNRYSHYDNEMFLKPSESSHSLMSQKSITRNANQILKFAFVLPDDKDKQTMHFHNKGDDYSLLNVVGAIIDEK